MDAEKIEAFREENSKLRRRLKPIEQKVRQEGGLTFLGEYQFSELTDPYLKIPAISVSLLKELERGDGAAAFEVYQSSAVPIYEVALKGLKLAQDLEFAGVKD